MKKSTSFGVWNDTDGLFASPDAFKTRTAARAFIRKFRRRFDHQGYYLTFRRERIPVEDVSLLVIELDEDESD